MSRLALGAALLRRRYKTVQQALKGCIGLVGGRPLQQAMGFYAHDTTTLNAA